MEAILMTTKTKRSASGGGPTREPKTLLEALRFLWRRVDEGKDRQRRLTERERDRLLPDTIEGSEGSGMIGDVVYRKHANGDVDVLNLDWLHAKRWPLFNVGDVSWVQIMGLVSRFDRNPLDHQDQATMAYLNELQKSGHFELFWRDHMLAGCPHLREELRGQSEAGDKSAGADDGQVDGVVDDPVAKAIALQISNPRMPVKQLAKLVGVSKSTLYADERFNDMRKVLKAATAARRANVPKGEKNDGHLEAEAPPSDWSAPLDDGDVTPI